jgi:hypothetical protein
LYGFWSWNEWLSAQAVAREFNRGLRSLVNEVNPEYLPEISQNNIVFAT